MKTAPNTAKQLLIWVAITIALAAVFMAYIRPEFVVELANQIWLCF
jgi:heme/copper-type cytochrome/quinol oxidase subunit 3